MERKKLTIKVWHGENVSAVLTMPDKKKHYRAGVIVAHGAGNDMEHEMLVDFSDGLARAGYPSLRFNFPYKEKGLKAPDGQKKLEATWGAVFLHFQTNMPFEVDHVIASGKSMGGRVASQMAAEKQLPADGLIFLGYPLHPAGDLTKTRDAHLYRLDVPLLFFAGTRDTLCDMVLFRKVLENISAPWQLNVIEGGDHSFHVPKSLGIRQSEIHNRVVKAAGAWLDGYFCKQKD